MYKDCQICGQPFRTKPSHYERRKTCSKKCFAVLKREQMTGEGNHQWGLKGEKNASWKGGRRKSNYGYILVTDPEYARDSDNYAFEHRKIMQEALGRRLRRDEVVHHINEDKTDNRLENLQVMSLAEHTGLHNLLDPQPRCSRTGRFVSREERTNDS